MFRAVKRSDFAGKTVKSINARAANVIKFTFTDGTKLDIWAETGPLSIPIMGIYQEDKKK